MYVSYTTEERTSSAFPTDSYIAIYISMDFNTRVDLYLYRYSTIAGTGMAYCNIIAIFYLPASYQVEYTWTIIAIHVYTVH